MSRPGRAARELAALGITGCLHLVFEEILDLKLPFLLLAGSAWGGYLLLSARRHRGRLREWQLGWRSHGEGGRFLPWAFLAGVALLGTGAALRGTLAWDPHLPLVLLIYPAWGVIQQFLFQALLIRNLDRLLSSRAAVVILGALAFALVHLPDARLAGATFALGLALAPLYLRGAALLPLGVAHGWLGALAYFWILERDPWTEIFGA